MAVYAINGALHELLVQTGIVKVFYLKRQLILEIMRRTLLRFQQITDACMQHGQIERLADEGISPTS